MWLNNFLGDEDDEPEIENVVRPTHARISLANCRGLGPSYRLLPKQVRDSPYSVKILPLTNL